MVISFPESAGIFIPGSKPANRFFLSVVILIYLRATYQADMTASTLGHPDRSPGMRNQPSLPTMTGRAKLQISVFPILFSQTSAPFPNPLQPPKEKNHEKASDFCSIHDHNGGDWIFHPHPILAYPEKPVSMICVFPAGGAMDMTARALSEAAKKYFPKPFAVVNRPGAAGTIGTAETIQARPDGYTIGITAVAVLTVQPHRSTPLAAEITLTKRGQPAGRPGGAPGCPWKDLGLRLRRLTGMWSRSDRNDLCWMRNSSR
jgi:hypothetical protein